MVSQGRPSLTHSPRSWGRICDSSLQRVKADTDYSAITRILNFPRVHKANSKMVPSGGANGRDRIPGRTASSYWSRPCSSLTAS